MILFLKIAFVIITLIPYKGILSKWSGWLSLFIKAYEEFKFMRMSDKLTYSCIHWTSIHWPGDAPCGMSSLPQESGHSPPSLFTAAMFKLAHGLNQECARWLYKAVVLSFKTHFETYWPIVPQGFQWGPPGIVGRIKKVQAQKHPPWNLGFSKR